jgi:uncharacterized protein YggU (UPF0235/DUF167 family)
MSQLQFGGQFRASADRVEGVVDGRLRIQRAAPPVENAANKAVVEVVAAWLGVPWSRVSVLAGDKTREKRLLVGGDGMLLTALLVVRLRG